MKKILGLLSFVFIAAVIFQTTNLYAVDVVANRSGEIRIEYADGTSENVGIDTSIGNLPSGSTVYMLNSSATVAPVDGYLKAVAGPSVATVEAGSGVTARYNRDNQTAYFECEDCEGTIVTGKTTTNIKKDQEAAIKLEESTGIADVNIY